QRLRVRHQSQFFFSSRRRHTRSYGDWSSDVCSSDLFLWPPRRRADLRRATAAAMRTVMHLVEAEPEQRAERAVAARVAVNDLTRSEERRVGKECRFWGVRRVNKKKT